MKFSAALLGAAALVGQTNAFPHIMHEMIASEAAKGNVKRQASFLTPGFNAEQQYVSNQGEHRFVPPGHGDLRGPCPGLNAMANHGYLPHNGVATIEQFTKGTYEVFGMGLDLANFLAVYGAVMDGDLTSWSIGGPPPSSLLDSGGLLGSPGGLIGSHNKYEADASPVRPDLYQYGNNYEIIDSQWKDLYALQAGVSEEESNYNLDILTQHRATRFDESIAENPYFWNGPFTGVLVQPAAYAFIYRFMANKSEEYPQGRLSKSVLKSFFGVEGTDESPKYNFGHERIPDNWYKRAIGDEYTISYFDQDLGAMAAQHPKFLSVGGNTGTTNSFTGVDITDLTDGVFNGASLLEGNNLMCFAFQAAVLMAPDFLAGIFTDPDSALNKLIGARDDAIGDLGCPQLNEMNNENLEKFPGYSKMKKNG